MFELIFSIYLFTRFSEKTMIINDSLNYHGDEDVFLHGSSEPVLIKNLMKLFYNRSLRSIFFLNNFTCNNDM